MLPAPPATDAGDAGVVGSSCHPGSVATYVPPTYVPAAPVGQGVCVPGDGGVDPIQLYYDDCVAPTGTRSACDGFAQISPEFASCQACIVSMQSAGAYGPLIFADGFVKANVAGCVEVESPSDLACAKAQQALFECELAACSANCPVVDSASLAQYETCSGQADDAGCQAYYSAAQCLRSDDDASADGGGSSPCEALTFEAFYESVVPVFCGPPADAGSPTTGEEIDAAGPGLGPDAGADAEGTMDAQRAIEAAAADASTTEIGDAAESDAAGPNDAAADAK
jgi:hypothetical protein